MNVVLGCGTGQVDNERIIKQAPAAFAFLDHKPPSVVVESTRRSIGIAAIACVPAAAGVIIRSFSVSVQVEV